MHGDMWQRLRGHVSLCLALLAEAPGLGPEEPEEDMALGFTGRRQILRSSLWRLASHFFKRAPATLAIWNDACACSLAALAPQLGQPQKVTVQQLPEAAEQPPLCSLLSALQRHRVDACAAKTTIHGKLNNAQHPLPSPGVQDAQTTCHGFVCATAGSTQPHYKLPQQLKATRGTEHPQETETQKHMQQRSLETTSSPMLSCAQNSARTARVTRYPH